MDKVVMAFYTSSGPEVRSHTVLVSEHASDDNLCSNKWPSSSSPSFRRIRMHGPKFQLSWRHHLFLKLKCVFLCAPYTSSHECLHLVHWLANSRETHFDKVEVTSGGAATRCVLHQIIVFASITATRDQEFYCQSHCQCSRR